MSHLFEKISRYFFTIKYLKFSQIYFRIFYKFFKIKNLRISGEAEFIFKKNIQNLKFKNNMHPNSHELEILNQKINIKEANIWKSNHDHLVRFNIHYFDFLNSNDAEKNKEKNIKLIDDWIDKNSNFLGDGWEPYTLSIRIVNWIKFINEHNINNQKFLNSLHEQIKFLVKRKEYNILANHLFSNLKAIIIGSSSLFFDGSIEILRKNLPELCNQIKEQILTDGTHFEQSPMYQNFFLFDLIELYAFFNEENNSAFNELKNLLELYIPKMARASDILSHPDSRPSFFNDSTINLSPTNTDIKRIINQVGINYEENLKKIENLVHGGFFRFNTEDICLIAKHGDIKCQYQPGHTHSDLASFEISYFEKRLVMNTGITTYEIGKKRDFERSSLSKNTISIEDRGSFETWKSFRIGRRAQNVFHKIFDDTNLNISYKGFYSWPNSVTHERTFYNSDNSIKICDSINSDLKNAISKVNISPDADIQIIEPKKLKISFMNKTIYFISYNEFELVDSYISYGFNKKINCKSIILKFFDRKASYEFLFK